MIRLVNLLSESADRLPKNFDLLLSIVTALDDLGNDLHLVVAVPILMDVGEVDVARVRIIWPHVHTTTLRALIVVDDHSAVGAFAPVDVIEALGCLREGGLGHRPLSSPGLRLISSGVVERSIPGPSVMAEASTSMALMP